MWEGRNLQLIPRDLGLVFLSTPLKQMAGAETEVPFHLSSFRHFGKQLKDMRISIVAFLLCSSF